MEECSVCKENISNADEIRTTLCRHQFHKSCLNSWVEKNPLNQTCPNCRSDVDSHRELIAAVYLRNSEKSIKKLIQLVEEGVDIEALDSDGYNALHHAVYLGKFNHVEVLLGSGSKIDALDMSDGYGWTSLMTASRMRNSKMVKLLLDCGADVTFKDRKGRTAQYLGNKEMQQIFEKFETVKKNADKEAKKKLDSVEEEWFLKKMEFGEMNQEDMNQEFADAVHLGNIPRVQVLLKHGVNVNYVHPCKNFGFTALFYAVLMKNESLVSVLLNYKPELNSNMSYTATNLFHLAAISHDITRMLRSRSNIDTLDMYDWTPLMTASRMGNSKMVKLLLKYGADVTLKDRKGRTARGLAYKDMQKMFQKFENENAKTKIQ